MTKRIADVLVGVATLGIREPNDAIAEFSDDQMEAPATHSVKLYKGGSGNDGSTHVQIIPPAGITLGTFDPTAYGFRHFLQAIRANWIQMELRFEDPHSVGWVELTAVPLQNALGTDRWVAQPLEAATPSGYGGVGEGGVSFFDWTLSTLTNAATEIKAEDAVEDSDDWVLKRVRLELWEATPERTCYVSQVTINGTDYTLHPGGSAPGMSLSGPYVTVGYTEDGVTFEYTADEADIDVDEETVSIDRVITKETIAVTCNMAQSSLYNLNKAIAGSVLSGNILTIGAGVNKKLNIRIEGVAPDGYFLTIILPKVTATGAVGTTYRRNEKNIVPVTFQALKPEGEPACTIVYNAA